MDNGVTETRAGAAALLVVVVSGCAWLTPATGAGTRTPRPISTATRPAVRRTPFGPLSPTATSPAPIQDATQPAVWPPPNSYGRWGPPAIDIPPPATPFAFPPGTLNLLLLGSDRRTGSGFRTDTIVLASIETAAKKVVLVSFPRDLYVYLPGNSISRINTAWIYGQSLHYPGGGPQLLMDTIRYNFGVPVDRYALVEMDGFQRIVDALGGIDVRVACPYTDWRLREPGLPEQRPSSWHLFTVLPGILHMDGDEALWYARARQHSTDFDRTRRQQEVLRAAYREALRPEVLARIPDLYQLLRDSVVTNLTLDDILALAPFAAQLGPVDLRSRFIGRDQVRSWRVPSSGAAVLLPDGDAIRRLLADAFAPAPDPAIDSRPTSVEIVPGRNAELDRLAQERLLYAGVEAVVTQGPSSEESSTRVMTGAEVPREEVALVLRVLGLPDSAARLDSEGTPPRAIRIRIGQDYRPCFDPARLTSSP
jgi:LCP family protein required for cell wall assembly